jgi:hypothetical protein
MSRELARIFCKKCCKIWGSADKSAYLRCKARVPYARQRSGKVPPKEVLKNKIPPYLYFVRHCLTYKLNITNIFIMSVSDTYLVYDNIKKEVLDA